MTAFVKLRCLGVVFATQAALMGTAFADAESVQKLDKGEINWSQKTLTVTGSGTFSNASVNAAQARIGATKAAKMDAQRNALEILKGVSLSSKGSVGQAMTSEVKAKVEGVLKNFEVVDTKYFSDGGVDVIIRVSLDGALADALVPHGEGAAAADSSVTSVIIDAKGLGAQPALSPRLVDDAGKEIYSSALVAADKLHEHGAAVYVRSLDAAKAEKRAGAKPLVVKAQKLAAPGKCDLVLSAKDAAGLKPNGQLLQALAEGHVVIVTD